MIVNQPHDEQLGIQLIKALESNQFNQLTIMVAYAKLSGVYRVSPYLEKFRNNGGTIRCVVGIDQQNTTYDALSQLLNLANEIYIFHSESVSQTFHIKSFYNKLLDFSNSIHCFPVRIINDFLSCVIGSRWMPLDLFRILST